MAPFDTDAERDAFLARPRLGMLLTNRAGGAPIGIPVWFDWTGETVGMFAGRSSPKVGRLQRDPRASLLVANDVGEPEAWVAFDGSVAIEDPGGVDLATRLAARYWDLNDPDRRAVLDSWQQSPNAFCLLTLTPERIRTGR